MPLQPVPTSTAAGANASNKCFHSRLTVAISLMVTVMATPIYLTSFARPLGALCTVFFANSRVRFCGSSAKCTLYWLAVATVCGTGHLCAGTESPESRLDRIYREARANLEEQNTNSVDALW